MKNESPEHDFGTLHTESKIQDEWQSTCTVVLLNGLFWRQVEWRHLQTGTASNVTTVLIKELNSVKQLQHNSVQHNIHIYTVQYQAYSRAKHKLSAGSVTLYRENSLLKRKQTLRIKNTTHSITTHWMNKGCPFAWLSRSTSVSATDANKFL